MSLFPTETEFKKIIYAADKSGEKGLYRCEQKACLFGATNDYEAIHFWLNNKVKNKPNTLRVYKTQAERLLMWAILEKQKPISSLNHNDFTDYMAFLENPMPRDMWCMDMAALAKKKRAGEAVDRKRFGKDWRPFKGPLSVSAKATAMHAINTMLNYWQEYSYIKANMLKMIDMSSHKQVADMQKLTVVERTLSQLEWTAIMNAIADMPIASREQRLKKARLHFLLLTLLITACRRQEIAQMRWSHFRYEREVWRLYVLGKGQKQAKITLPDKYIEIANTYRQELNLPALSNKDNEELPVITKLTSLEAISGDSINFLVKNICSKAQEYTADIAAKEILRRASVHWLRHTAATMLDDSGVDKALIKQHLRHQSDATTEIYIHKNIDLLKNTLEQVLGECIITG